MICESAICESEAKELLRFFQLVKRTPTPSNLLTKQIVSSSRGKKRTAPGPMPQRMGAGGFPASTVPGSIGPPVMKRPNIILGQGRPSLAPSGSVLPSSTAHEETPKSSGAIHHPFKRQKSSPLVADEDVTSRITPLHRTEVIRTQPGGSQLSSLRTEELIAMLEAKLGEFYSVRIEAVQTIIERLKQASSPLRR